MQLREPLPELFTSSRTITLDFAHITESTPDDENLQRFFATVLQAGNNPRKPEHRQAFNDALLQKYGCRYLIGQYGEDRSAMLADTPAGKEGRTYHMAVDIFSTNLEPIYAPCDGTIVRSSHEEGFGEYGNYLIMQPESQDFYIFFGHLSSDKHNVGSVTAGEPIAALGDYVDNENGGWSRHLHLQILRELPPEGKTPNGYASKQTYQEMQRLYPSPFQYFPDWQINIKK